ncbi:hypothetical protein BL243_24395 [Ralstonia solanacearum]|nr:hypothetical protein BL243_24395 [Ralstonia solanacearum]
MVDVRSVDESRDQWALAIGRFLVAFTSCEYWTYLYAGTFGSDALREAVSSQNLGPRAAIARALVLDLRLEPDIRARVEMAFDRLSSLATPRNLVAHNPPLFHMYSDDRGNVVIQRELRSAKDPAKDVSIARLAELTENALQLEEEFALLYGLVCQEGNRIDAVVQPLDDGDC